MCFEDILTLYEDYEVQIWINLINFGMLLSKKHNAACLEMFCTCYMQLSSELSM